MKKANNSQSADKKTQSTDSQVQGTDSQVQSADSQIQGTDSQVQSTDSQKQGADSQMQSVESQKQGAGSKRQCPYSKQGVGKKRRSPVFYSVRALTLSAMLTAMSVVIGIFCKNFLNFGGGLFRITFENLPIIISGIAIGPITGALVGVASDIISYFLSNQIYPPNLVVTLGAAIIGCLSGILARYIPKSRAKLRIIASGAVSHFVGSIIVKSIGLFQFYGYAVLWRIPLYLIIATIEISLICALYKNKSIKSLIDEGDVKI